MLLVTELKGQGDDEAAGKGSAMAFREPHHPPSHFIPLLLLPLLCALLEGQSDGEPDEAGKEGEEKLHGCRHLRGRRGLGR
jgi:hypothetical protein